jgi:hypothetical protein
LTSSKIHRGRLRKTCNAEAILDGLGKQPACIKDLVQKIRETPLEFVERENDYAVAGAGDKCSRAQLRSQLRMTLSDLGEGLVEREVEVSLMLLAALSGEHLLLLGTPGTAKSEISRRLSKICRASFFERQLSKFTVPEEIFGPLSLRELEQDRYIRKTDGYLPDCSFAFLDEIFKVRWCRSCSFPSSPLRIQPIAHPPIQLNGTPPPLHERLVFSQKRPAFSHLRPICPRRPIRPFSTPSSPLSTNVYSTTATSDLLKCLYYRW